MSWRLADRAKADLRAIVSCTTKRWGKPVADRFAERLFKLILRLAARPRIGRARPEHGPGIRSFPFRSFIVFYRVADDGEVEIVHVRHAKRRQPRL